MTVYVGYGGSTQTIKKIYFGEKSSSVNDLPPFPVRNARLVFEDNMLSAQWDSVYPLTKIEVSQPFTSKKASCVFYLSNFNNKFVF